VGGGGIAPKRTVTRSKSSNISLHCRQMLTSARFQNILLSFAVARHWPDVSSNAVSPGWVSTKMGGAGAPGSMKKATELPARLAASDPKDIGSGKYYVAQHGHALHRAAEDQETQDEFLKICENISGVSFPK
jgi:NAD(P)-dependent dehydrogenase (short-subunit alcohol dehydrogenase family)